MRKRLIALALCVLTVLSLAACGELTWEDLPDAVSLSVITGEANSDTEKNAAGTTRELLPEDTEETDALIDEDGKFTTKEDVALYIHTYGHLPVNFITKKTAEELGWTGGSLEPYAKGMCIGGDRYGNYEGLLPDAPGRTYSECDIDTKGASSRGAKRIVFSNDGLIYYTDDHYKSFTLLYGGDEG